MDRSGINKNDMQEIGGIGNYYGHLNVKQEDGKFYWSIENHSGCLWQEVPKELYDSLLKFDQDCENGLWSNFHED